MGKRSEPRKDIQVPVRIFGTDAAGAVFSQKAVTVNISRTGVELAGVQSQISVDEIIGLSYGANRVHFRVRWVGKTNTPKAGHVGLRSVSPGKPLWDFPLDSASQDPYEPGFAERRQHPRYRCHNSVEIHIRNGASFWGTVADLGLGGCYVEMAFRSKLVPSCEWLYGSDRTRPGLREKWLTEHRALASESASQRSRTKTRMSSANTSTRSRHSPESQF
jgi:hypothetical protein